MVRGGPTKELLEGRVVEDFISGLWGTLRGKDTVKGG